MTNTAKHFVFTAEVVKKRQGVTRDQVGCKQGKERFYLLKIKAVIASKRAVSAPTAKLEKQGYQSPQGSQ